MEHIHDTLKAHFEHHTIEEARDAFQEHLWTIQWTIGNVANALKEWHDAALIAGLEQTPPVGPCFAIRFVLANNLEGSLRGIKRQNAVIDLLPYITEADAIQNDALYFGVKS